MGSNRKCVLGPHERAMGTEGALGAGEGPADGTRPHAQPAAPGARPGGTRCEARREGDLTVRSRERSAFGF